MGPKRRQGGFSFLELVVVLILISILLVVALERLQRYRAQAEQVAVAQVIGGLQSALGLELARRAVRQRIASLSDLDRGNPIDLLNQPPHNYLGERREQDAAQLEPGHWFYDPGQQALIYLVEADAGFQSPLDGPPRIRLQMRLNYDDLDGDGRFDVTRDEIHGLRIDPLEPYRWREPP